MKVGHIIQVLYLICFLFKLIYEKIINKLKLYMDMNILLIYNF